MNKGIFLAMQHVFTIFTGTIAGSTMLASGAGACLWTTDTAGR